MVAGIVLICAGILMAFVGLKLQFDDCAYRWSNDLDGFGRKYASIWDCFWLRSKVAILVSLIFGLIPIGLGSFICKRR